MNKTELAVQVAAITGVSKKDALASVEAVFQVIGDALVNGDEVSIAGHGKYDIRERSARTGVNPTLLKQLKDQGVDAATAKSQAAIAIDASKSVGFKPSKALKDAVK